MTLIDVIAIVCFGSLYIIYILISEIVQLTHTIEQYKEAGDKTIDEIRKELTVEIIEKLTNKVLSE